MPVENLHDDCEAHRAISELKTKWSWVCDHFGLWSCNEVALPGIFAGVRVFNRKATATGRLVWKWAMHSTRLLSLIIKYSHSSAASDGHTQHQIHFYNMKLTFALHEILLPRFNGGYIPLPHTPLIDLGLLWFIHCIHCDSLRFMGHIGPHQLNCALCASCLPPRNCWSSLCLLPPVKLLQGSQLTQTRNDRLMDCAAVCVIVRFEYFEYFEYWFHHVPSCSICLKIVWKSFEITGTWSCHEALWLIHETLDSRLSPSSAVRQESQILPWLQVVARREKRRSGEAKKGRWKKLQISKTWPPCGSTRRQCSDFIPYVQGCSKQALLGPSNSIH